jgi:hypothetical protein
MLKKQKIIPESSKTDSKRIIIGKRQRISREEGTGSEKEGNSKENETMSSQSERNGRNLGGPKRKHLDERTNNLLEAAINV